MAAMAAMAVMALALPSAAAVTLQPLFSDHMVVQRDIPVPIFGAAAANEAVTVKLGTVQAEGKADAQGRFQVSLPAMPAGGPFTLTVTGSNTVTLTDVYVGEVWIGSGQSNMDYKVDCVFSGCVMKDEAKEIAEANYPLIRSINVERKGAATPQTTMTAPKKWMVASPTTVGGFSAVGYFFARELHRNLPNVAIGIIHASYGASTLECWMSKESLAGVPSFASLFTAYEKTPDHADQHNPYNCYNGQIAPLKPYGVRGTIWYQGESVSRGEATYRDLQVELIKSWRREWAQDMTFIVAQLANHQKDTKPLIREAQMQAVQMVPNAGLAVTIDIGDRTQIHAPNKQDAGLRMGLAARAIAYQQPIHYTGPIYNRMEVEGSAIRIYFKQASGGLLLKGTADDSTFQIAGETGNFVKATAVIDKDTTLLVSAASVAAPKRVHYAHAFFPTATLYSKVLPNLPASPFRTEAPSFVPVATGLFPGTAAPSPANFDFRAVRNGHAGGISLVYGLPGPAQVSLDLYDVQGRKWVAAAASRKAAGIHTFEVSLAKGGGEGRFGEGVYYARLRVDGNEKVIPVVF